MNTRQKNLNEWWLWSWFALKWNFLYCKYGSLFMVYSLFLYQEQHCNRFWNNILSIKSIHLHIKCWKIKSRYTYIAQNIKVTIQLSTQVTGLQSVKNSLCNKWNGTVWCWLFLADQQIWVEWNANLHKLNYYAPVTGTLDSSCISSIQMCKIVLNASKGLSKESVNSIIIIFFLNIGLIRPSIRLLCYRTFQQSMCGGMWFVGGRSCRNATYKHYFIYFSGLAFRQPILMLLLLLKYVK